MDPNLVLRLPRAFQSGRTLLGKENNPKERVVQTELCFYGGGLAADSHPWV